MRLDRLRGLEAEIFTKSLAGDEDTDRQAGAFVAAGRQIPLWAAQDANELGCFWQEHKADNPNFQMGNVSGRNWIVRLALRKAVAAVQGIPNDEPSIIELPLVEDSFSSDAKLQPACDKGLPPDALLSSGLTTDELKALFK